MTDGESKTDAVAVVDAALNQLVQHLGLTVASVNKTHTALAITGLDDSLVTAALGQYLVGLIAGVVQTDLTLSVALLGHGPDASEQLRQEVDRLLEPAETASAEAKALFRQNVRDPWIAEGLGHALLAIRQRTSTECLPGQVAAMVVPHPAPSRQGLDLLAVYDCEGEPALALGEAKATRNGGSSRLTEAVTFFHEVAAGERDLDIRMQVVVLKPALSAELCENLSYGFWHQRSCYLPMITHGDEVPMNRNRKSLREINRPASEKRVVFGRPQHYDRFFDDVSTAMKSAVAAICS
jgi:hypothetical protein